MNDYEAMVTVRAVEYFTFFNKCTIVEDNISWGRPRGSHPSATCCWPPRSSSGRFSGPENSSASSFCWGSLNSASILRRLTPHTRLTSNFNLDP
ncbi:hypothetical protein BpHYR1_031002 [Brachionus plicatilis]|uniref:Uncharacterized protein n=1 Tax=Brachionus plicatilis TaxID=10195 RepID=A0A3M7SUP1_BRAPC|nr:hypothetical protein BpHYR1_031002 [Brachionus plicatilis]